MGDFNIDLLKSDSHAATSDFINTLFSASYFPLINRPTRVAETTATLIDNIFTNQYDEDNHLSGIIPTDFPIFHFHYDSGMSPQPDKISFCKRIMNEQNINKFNSEIQSMGSSS